MSDIEQSFDIEQSSGIEQSRQRREQKDRVGKLRSSSVRMKSMPSQAAKGTAARERDRRRKYQRRHVNLGLCVLCSRPSVTSSLCQRHRRKTWERYRKRVKTAGALRCGLCGSRGHNRRTCMARRIYR